ncbi:pectate lyase [Candidatus Sumerlaeota bacterium]|nr:pectate lyase [Candidatus Sumerlaeota bacterium]
MFSPKSTFRLVVLVAVSILSIAAAKKPVEPPFPVRPGQDGRLAYEIYDRGDRVPDFSHCGFAGAAEAIPAAPVAFVVSPAEGDDGARIQRAIDHVSGLTPTPTSHGMRGAVLLEKGRYEVSGRLLIRASGVVLRGSGMGEDGTVLVADGHDRRTLIGIAGKNDRATPHPVAKVTDEYVPVGAYTMGLSSTEGLKPGDTILVTRPGTEEWVDALGMSDLGGGRHGPRWHAENVGIVWDRVVASVDGNTVTLDAPLTTSLDIVYGGGTVQEYEWPGRIERVGVENMRLESAYDKSNPKDESHSWGGIAMENVQNAWVRQVAFLHFAGTAVSLWETTKWVTVQDCKSLDPISEIGGFRRHTFFTAGQMCLFLRCWSEHGRHDFAVGHCAAGPNAFVACETFESLGDSGPIQSWASGILYDNVRIDNAALDLENRWTERQGAGWSAANCMLWQSVSSEMRCFNPPTARNWSVGCWADFIGDGIFTGGNDSVSPDSLYLAQLGERCGPEAAARMGPIVHFVSGSSNPTYEEAARLVAASNGPAPQALDLIDKASEREPIPTDASQAKTIDDMPAPAPEPSPSYKRLALKNGWITVDDKLKTGGGMEAPWWRGNLFDFRHPAPLAVTRFVPCRPGQGYTDDLNELTDAMVASSVAFYDQHYPLWYERRRDDHERIRRATPDVCPPFYEYPFARSGRGTAWDGLSKYDLTRPNPWYWDRLKEFAGLCDRKGLVLFYESFFQHHILEAGAHWADCPWRTANNVNDTGFPEPPPYIGDKRIFQAHLFYDVNHPVRRSLYEGYIRETLDRFAENSNVILFTSDEFTGPREFVEFWIDTIVAWEKETGRDALIALSCTKDVQDAILADPIRGAVVSVIDIKYWWYQNNGEPYAPEGGRSLAPRQHFRLLKPQSTSFEQTVRAVWEYRSKYPDKAVVCRVDRHDPLAALIGGASLPALRSPFDESLLAAILKMRPLDGIVEDEKVWCFGEPGSNYLISSLSEESVKVPLEGENTVYTVRGVNPDGSLKDQGTVNGKAGVEVPSASGSPTILWLSRR